MSKHPAKKQPRTGTKRATEGEKIVLARLKACLPSLNPDLEGLRTRAVFAQSHEDAKAHDRAIRRAVRADRKKRQHEITAGNIENTPLGSMAEYGDDQ